MSGFRLWFNNLSLYKKIFLIVSLAVALAYMGLFLVIRSVLNRYEKELYQSGAQSLNYVSTAIADQMQVIGDISDSVISDSSIQGNLSLLKEQPDIERGSSYKRNVYETLYTYMFKNDYIRSIHIILEDGSDICMGSSAYIDEFDRTLLETTARSSEGRVSWVPGYEAGGNVACVRIIRRLEYLRLDTLADLYLIIDMEKLIGDALTGVGYSPNNENFLLLKDGHLIYPENTDYSAACGQILSQIISSGDSYVITPLMDVRKFVIYGTIPGVGWEYLYFRDYDTIFRELRIARTVLLGSFLLSLAMSLLLVRFLSQRILRHLGFLLEKIRCFGSGETVPETISHYDYSRRQDEIGLLHRSFDEMTRNVATLQDENLNKQILLRDAKIQMLQQQINPHFLYNTLDTINWMAKKYHADDISLMARSLGNLFRGAISGQDDIIPLSDELAFLNNYIQIQKIRFKDRLNFELLCPEDISAIRVPRLCIQPLVENALKYSMDYTDQVCTIRVAVEIAERNYLITIANTGSRFEEDLLRKIKNQEITPQGSGVGLVNIDSRLKLLYGNHYGLVIYNREGMAVVMLRIPKEREAPTC